MLTQLVTAGAASLALGVLFYMGRVTAREWYQYFHLDPQDLQLGVGDYALRSLALLEPNTMMTLAGGVTLTAVMRHLAGSIPENSPAPYERPLTLEPPAAPSTAGSKVPPGRHETRPDGHSSTKATCFLRRSRTMGLRRPFGGRTLEQRIAERQAGLPPLKRGRTFEHGPAKFIFFALLIMIVLGHLLVLIIYVAH